MQFFEWFLDVLPPTFETELDPQNLRLDKS